MDIIPVTKTYIPDLQFYYSLLDEVMAKGWLTNRGENVKDLEGKILEKLNIQGVKALCMANGTIPLQIAIKILGNGGEIITTPFSYVATTSSIVWENCFPKFVDIHPEYFTIDENKIEEKITERTSCILATHVFGNPCEIEKIQSIAEKYNLHVIYDASHCFGASYNGKSLFEYGDISTCSFHATKLFHTGEGGALFTHRDDLYEKAFNYHNFGHDGPESFKSIGINGKMSELHASLGLSVLKDFDKIIAARKRISEKYYSELKESVLKFKIRKGTEWNYSYFPIVLPNEEILKQLIFKLNNENIFPRRYFYPSLDKLPYVEQNNDLIISRSISERVLCIPIYYDLEDIAQKQIIDIINSFDL